MAFMEFIDFGRTLLTIQMDYVEMPDLKLTLREAAHLWTLPIEVCDAAVTALVAAGFLVRTVDGSYLRRGTPPVRVEPVDALTWVIGRSLETPSIVH
jgi:hypothetical protein